MKKFILIICALVMVNCYSSNAQKKFMGIPEDKLNHIGVGVIGSAFVYGGTYYFLTEFTSLDHRWSKLISGIVAVGSITIAGDNNERQDNFYSSKDLVCSIAPAVIVSIGLSFTFGKPPKPTLRRGRKEGVISRFAYQYMNTSYKRCITDQDYAEFIYDFESLEMRLSEKRHRFPEASSDELPKYLKFIPVIEMRMIKDSLFISENPYSFLKQAKNNEIITSRRYRILTKFYRTSYGTYDLDQMRIFKKQYDFIKEELLEKE